MRKALMVLLVSFLLLHAVSLRAQEAEQYIYQDTSIMAPENTQDAPADDNVVYDDEDQVEKNTSTYVLDTSLVSNQRVLSPDSVSRIKKRKEFAYANNLDSLLKILKTKDQQVSYANRDATPSWLDTLFSALFTRYLLWALAIAFVAFIVYNLFFTQGFFQRSAAKSRVNIIPEVELLPVSNNDYDNLIQKTIQEKDYRLGIRYLYLQLIHHLAHIGAIEYAPDKTNSTYLRDLSGKTYKPAVELLTRNYEYIWYGEFAIDEARFTMLFQQFQQLKNLR